MLIGLTFSFLLGLSRITNGANAPGSYLGLECKSPNRQTRTVPIRRSRLQLKSRLETRFLVVLLVVCSTRGSGDRGCDSHPDPNAVRDVVEMSQRKPWMGPKDWRADDQGGG